MVVPPKWWLNVLNCRKCKTNLVSFFVTLFHTQNQANATTTTAGGLEGPLRNQALFINFKGTPQHDTHLSSNAEETDTRIWLHTINSFGQRKLIQSPDTDVYHIGLPIIAETNLDVIVQLSPFSWMALRLLDMQALNSAIRNDPDLAATRPPL